MQIPKRCGSLDPSVDHLPDSAGGHTITARELSARPSLYEVEHHDAPLNIRTVLLRKYRNLRGKANTATPDCQPNTGETFTRYAAFHTGACLTHHTRRLHMSREKVIKVFHDFFTSFAAHSVCYVEVCREEAVKRFSHCFGKDCPDGGRGWYNSQIRCLFPSARTEVSHKRS